MPTASKLAVIAPDLGFSAAEANASDRVDREARIIYGVAVITQGEAKGHDMQVDGRTLEQVRDCALTYADGLKVKADHGSGVMAAAGTLRNLRIDGRTLRGDLHVLRSYEHAEKLFEMAETMPSTFGLSISFSGTPHQHDGQDFARCAEIYSADLVSEPAANPDGLFSQKNKPQHQFDMTEKELKDAVASAVSEQLAAITEEYSSKFAALETAVAKFAATEDEELEKGDDEEEMEESEDDKPKDEEMGMKAVKAELASLKSMLKDFAKNAAAPATVKPAATDRQGDGPDAATRFASAVTARKAELPLNRKADAFGELAKKDPEGYRAFSSALKSGKTFKL